MNPSSQKWIYPINLPNLARYLAQQRIDIAPHRMEWELCARDIANALGEEGREVFHTIASVWPGYDRRDSEHCYNRALSRRNHDDRHCSYIRQACRQRKVELDTPQLRDGDPYILMGEKTIESKQKQKNLDLDFFLKTQMKGRDILAANYLTDLLLRLYPQKDVLRVLDDYCVGFYHFVTKKLLEPLIFWYINEDMNLINAKLMQYKVDGHRDKNIPPRIMFPENPISLFGLHLRDTHDKVAIVESEKSCLIMSLELPNYTWMAVGGLNFFNEEMLNPIRDKQIIAYPDVDLEYCKPWQKSFAFTQWKTRTMQLAKKGFNIECSEFLEDQSSSYDRLCKYDIADLYLNDRIRKFQKWN